MPDLPQLPTRARDAHKGSAGRVLVIAGSLGMSGAGFLATRAAMRSGAGLVTWAVPACVALVAEMTSTESITLPVPATEAGHFGIAAREILSEASHEADVCVLGPGVSAYGETGELLRLLIPEIHAPLLIDAGGLSALAGDWKPLGKRRQGAVITPHPGEAARLLNLKPADIQADRKGAAKRLADESGAVALLKGAGTVVTDGKEFYVNDTGNCGMATAGAGDVLSGIIAGLIAQGLGIFEATKLGAHLHGLAGDLACQEKGVWGLVAGDIVDHLPAAFMQYAGGDGKG